MHFLHQIAYRPGVNLPAKLALHLDLVAFGHRDIPHIVTEAHHFHLARHRHAHGGFHPIADAGLHLRILPISRHHLARFAQAGTDEPVLAVAVRRLVEVHKIHVDLIVRDLAVILRGEMQPRLLQIFQPRDPHFGGRKGVAPSHNPGAGIVKIRLFDHIGDLGAAFGGHLVPQRKGQRRRQRLRHLFGAVRHGAQHILAV